MPFTVAARQSKRSTTFSQASLPEQHLKTSSDISQAATPQHQFIARNLLEAGLQELLDEATASSARAEAAAAPTELRWVPAKEFHQRFASGRHALGDHIL